MLSIEDTDAYKSHNNKTVWYTQLWNRLIECLPGWEVGIQTFTMGPGDSMIQTDYTPTWPVSD